MKVEAIKAEIMAKAVALDEMVLNPESLGLKTEREPVEGEEVEATDAAEVETKSDDVADNVIAVEE